MWDRGYFSPLPGFRMSRVLLGALLLVTIVLPGSGQIAGATGFDTANKSAMHRGADDAGCTQWEPAIVVAGTPEPGRFGRLVEAAGRRKDNIAEALAEVAPDKPAILVTAGDAVGGMIDSAKEKGANAWTALSESELAMLLNSTVHWTAYEDLMRENPSWQSTAGPAVEFALGLSPNGDIATRDILINTALLAVPAGRLAPVLGKGTKLVVSVGPDVAILVDNVAVVWIKNGAKLVTGLVEGRVDTLGRVVVLTSGALPPVLLTSLPVQAQRVATSQLKAQRSTGVRGSGTYFANADCLLPIQHPGYYRQFPVDVSDAPDGSVQWIIIGENGELYLTKDSGKSFAEVITTDPSLIETVAPVEADSSDLHE